MTRSGDAGMAGNGGNGGNGGDDGECLGPWPVIEAVAVKGRGRVQR